MFTFLLDSVTVSASTSFGEFYSEITKSFYGQNPGSRSVSEFKSITFGAVVYLSVCHSVFFKPPNGSVLKHSIILPIMNW